MEYNYPHERTENPSNPETSQGHPQNQHLVHYQHQQYPPSHHAIQAGYTGLRLTPYMNPLQGAGTPVGLVHAQEGGLVQPPRVPTSASAGSSRDSSQSSHEFENVLSNVMQGSSVQGHYQQELPPHSQHGMPLQQIPPLPSRQPSPPVQQSQAHTGGGDAYHIEDLSHATHNSSHSRMPNSSSGGVPMITAPLSTGGHVNTTKSSSQVIASTGRTPKKRAAPGSSPKQPSKQPSTMRAPMAQIMTPQVYQQTSQVPQQQQRARECISFSKHCQTDPLFQQVYQASVQFSKEKELPEGLEFREDEKEKKTIGVVATKDFGIGVEFGPFTGEFVKEGLGCFNPNTWEVCVKGQTWYYIDGATDPNNWMYHVQYARNTDEQNLEAFQFYGDIYFRITKPIKSGTDLRVFYSQDYCKHVGFKTSLDNLLFFKDAQRFECRDCDNRYTNSKSLFRHIKFEHDKENNLIPPEHVEPAKSAPPPKPKIPNLMTIKDVAAKMQRDKERDAEKNKGRERPKVDKSKKFMKVKLVPLGKSEKDEKEEEFSCKRCRKKFPSEGHLKEHAAFHKEMKDVKPICEVCGLECKHTKALKQHQLAHNPDAYQCEYCKRYFRRKGCLVYHLRHVHQTFVGEKWTRGNAQEQMTRYVGPGEEDDEDDFHPELPKDMLESDEEENTTSDEDEGTTSDEEEGTGTFDEEDQDQDEDTDDEFTGEEDNSLKKDIGMEQSVTDEEDDTGKDHREQVSRIKPRRRLMYSKKIMYSKSSRYTCRLCGEEFDKFRAMDQHVMSHNPNNFQCQYCKWYFKRKCDLVFHLRSKHQVSMGKRWTRFEKEELMEPDKIGKKEEEEEGDDFTSGDDDSVGDDTYGDLEQTHTVEEDNRGKDNQDQVPSKRLGIMDPKASRYTCRLCGKEFDKFRAMEQHEMSHNPNNFQCQYCKWYFKRKWDLVFHLRSKHQVSIGKKWTRFEKEELMELDKIGNSEEEEGDDFTSEDDDSVGDDTYGDWEQTHTVEEDNRGKDDQEQVPSKRLGIMDPMASRYTCRLCGKEFDKFRAVEQHEMSHNPNNFQCPHCKWYFKRKCDLVFHLRSKHQVSIGKKWTRFEKEELMKPDKIGNKEEDNCDNITVDNDDNVEDDTYRDLEQHHTDEEDETGKDDQEQVQSRLGIMDSKASIHVGLPVHTCRLCGEEFDKFRALEQHEMSHNPNNFQCPYCKWYFKRKYDLTFHLRSKHQVSMGKKWTRFEKEELMEPDKIGKKEEDNLNNLTVEDDSVERGKDTEQIHVHEEDEREKDDQEHLPRKIPRKIDPKASIHTCRLCGKEFEKFRAMEQHEMSHNPNNFQCQYCKWYFKRKADLTFHLRTKHKLSIGKKWSRVEKEELMEPDKLANEEEGDDEFIAKELNLHRKHPVNVAKRGYILKERLKYAVGSKDGKAPKHQDQVDLQSRSKVRPEDSPKTYSCQFCIKKFTNPDFLMKHESIVHVNFMTFRCRVCRKAFSSKGALQSHSHIHQREKRFECFICQQKFSSNDLLVNHLMHHDQPGNSEMVYAAMQQDIANNGAES